MPDLRRLAVGCLAIIRGSHNAIGGADQGLSAFVPASSELEPLGSGVLDGTSIAVKDLFEVAGHVSSFGHPRWRETHEPAAADAFVVDAIRHAGGHVVGMTKLDQLAFSLIGDACEGAPPGNVFDPESFCGGSSSGSAAAVAAAAADLGVGTDTVGSIRVPAAACGLFGIRTTHGLLGNRGALPLARSFDVPGFLARDPAMLLRGLAAVGVPAAQPTRLAFGRVLVPVDLVGEAGPNTCAAVAALAQQVARVVGATQVGVRCRPFVGPDAADLCARIQGREVWAEHGDWVIANGDSLAPDVSRRLERCRRLAADPAGTVAADLEARRLYVAGLARLTGGDLLVMPTIPSRGPLRTATDDRMRAWRRTTCALTAPSSIAGRPELVVPCELEGVHSPLSVVGPPGSDAALVRLADRLAESGRSVRLEWPDGR